jgi:hypothetical protein
MDARRWREDAMCAGLSAHEAASAYLELEELGIAVAPRPEPEEPKMEERRSRAVGMALAAAYALGVAGVLFLAIGR